VAAGDPPEDRRGGREIVAARQRDEGFLVMGAREMALPHPLRRARRLDVPRDNGGWPAVASGSTGTAGYSVRHKAGRGERPMADAEADIIGRLPHATVSYVQGAEALRTPRPGCQNS
jgi:hypothetical protein